MATLVTGNVQKLGDFELLAKLGEGGMGAVYKARQISMNRVVALKLLPPKLAENAQFIQRFLLEARATARLNHPHIISGIDVGVCGGYHYFAMEYVEGRTLRGCMPKRGLMPEAEVIRIGAAIASALRHAHVAGIVHRDVKPDNILLSHDGTPKLADLGLVKAEDGSLTQTGFAMGTPHYMAPEQARGDKTVDGRADIYALGCTLYHAATGRTPFEGQTPAVLMVKHINEKIPHPQTVNPDLSDGFCAVLDNMLARRREDRYVNAQQVADDFAEMLAGGLPGRGPLPPNKTNFQKAAARSPSRGATNKFLPVGNPRMGTCMLQPVSSSRVTRSSGRLERPSTGGGGNGNGNGNGVLVAGGAGAGVLLLAVIMVASGGKPRAVEMASNRKAPVEPAYSAPSYAARPQDSAPPPRQTASVPFESTRRTFESPRPDRPIPNSASPAAAPWTPSPAASAPELEKTALPAPSPASVAAPAEPQTPAKPNSMKDSASVKVSAAPAAARPEYSAFSDDFLNALRKRDPKAAAERLKQAEKESVFAGREKDCEQDRRMLDWMADVEKAVAEGLLKLKDVDSFELGFTRGQPIQIGKRGDTQVQEVKDGRVYYGSKGMSTQMPLALLSSESREKLADLGLGGDAPAQVRRAFVALLGLERPDPKAIGNARTALERAKKSGAGADEMACLERHLQTGEAAARETAAKAAWADVSKVAESKKQHAALKAALIAFSSNFADTAFGKEKRAEAEALLAKAEEMLALAQGYYYDFDSAASYVAFTKNFWSTGVGSGRGEERWVGMQEQVNGKLRVTFKNDPKAQGHYTAAPQDWQFKEKTWAGDWEFYCKVRFDIPAEASMGIALYFDFSENNTRTSGCYLIHSGNWKRLFGGLVDLQYGMCPNYGVFEMENRRIDKNAQYEINWVKMGSKLTCSLSGTEIYSGEIPEVMLERMQKNPVRVGIFSERPEGLAAELDDFYFGPIRSKKAASR